MTAQGGRGRAARTAGLLACALATASWAAPARGSAAEPLLSVHDQRLLNACTAAFEAGRPPDLGMRRAAGARRAGLRRSLERVLQAVPAGSHGHCGLAYVLSYLRMDRAANLRRMMTPYARWRRDEIPVTDAVEALPSALGCLYEHDRDPVVGRTLLDMLGDGALAEELQAVRVRLFMRYPPAVLALASESAARLRILAEDLAFENEDARQSARIRRLLRAEAHRGPASARRAARYCLRRALCESARPPR